jgi:hypothetical protein
MSRKENRNGWFKILKAGALSKEDTTKKIKKEMAINTIPKVCSAHASLYHVKGAETF